MKPNRSHEETQWKRYRRRCAGPKPAHLARLVATGLFFLTLFLTPAPMPGQIARPGGSGPKPLEIIKGREYTFEKWADGVYQATGGAGSQDCIIVNERDVLLFDAGSTPGGARALMEDLKLLTDKPIRTVVNSHFHYDHAFGNSAFGPDVQIIAHRYTRTALQSFDTMHREPFLTWINRNSEVQVKTLSDQVASEKDPQRKALLEGQLAATKRDVARAAEIRPVPPTITFDSKMVLNSGGREIQLLFLGRGHTAGDIVLYLPKERILCSGDLIEGGISYLGDGFFDEWVTTLEALKKLDFTVCLPGHGAPFSDKEHVTALQSYLVDLVDKVAAVRAQGVPAEEALRRVDLSSHEKDWPPRMRPIDIRGMRRVYQWLEERAAR
jgi:glyoxylase-like metal-dependent hydrolase (beta-lactamase superfamily II)